MRMYTTLASLLLILIIILAWVIWVEYNPYWVLVMASSGIVFGALSVMVYSRRLMYMAAASPHSAFLAASLSIPLSLSLGLSMDVWMLLVGLLLIYLVGLLAYKGMDPDEATSLFVGFSASGGVLASYYVLTHYPFSSSIVAVVFGDPLLASRSDVIISVATAIALLLFVYTSVGEIVYIGADLDDALLSGLRVWLYDLALYTAIGVSVLVMVKSVGFILEHVLILLPGLTAHYATKGVYKTLTLSILVALFSSILGLALAVVLNQSPSAMTGMILVGAFITAYIGGWRR